MTGKHDNTHHLHQKIADLPDLMSNGLPDTSIQEDAAGQRFITESSKRSTIDPLEINFGDASIADALQSKYATSAQRFWTWFLRFIPASMWTFLGMFAIWKPLSPNWIDMRPESDKVEDVLFKLLFSAVVLALPVFWVFVLARRQKIKRKSPQ